MTARNKRFQKEVNRTRFGVNANSTPPKKIDYTLATPGRAGTVASLYLAHVKHVVAIDEVDLGLDLTKLESLKRAEAFIRKVVTSYQGAEELPDWSKFVSPQMKQYFRVYAVCTQPNAKTFTVRLDKPTARAALAAPRGPANYLGEVIKRTLSRLGLNSNMAFNLEFTHSSTMASHPLHIHGALCIPDEMIGDAAKALRNALAKGYRQRYGNAAVHICKPMRAHWWASYCVKEYSITADRLIAETGMKTRPEFAPHSLSKQAKAFYDGISSWLDYLPHREHSQ